MNSLSERRKIVNNFKKYSRLGLASKRLDAFGVYERIMGVSRTKKEAKELLAVYETVKFLRLTENTDALKALYSIYFFRCSKKVQKSEISNRILRYAYENHLDERTVYRRLSYVINTYKRIIGDI